jgi:Tfp pilus assembly protein PilV
MRRPDSGRRTMACADRRARRGAALIETLIALVVLAFAGAGMISLLAETLARVHDLHARERDTAAAARALETMASFSRAELRARVGVTRQPTVWVEINQSAPALFDVIARDTLVRAELLRTTIYRPDTLP